MDIEGWLRGIGLAEYAEMFRANDINIELLSQLTNDDLKDIGVVSLGHRKKLLEANRAGAVSVSAEPALSEPLGLTGARSRAPFFVMPLFDMRENDNITGPAAWSRAQQLSGAPSRRPAR